MKGPAPTSRNGHGLYELDASVVGVFRDPHDVNRAVRQLTAKSVPADSIRVFLVDEAGERRREVEVESEAGALKGALIGAAAGAGLGVVIVILVPILMGGVSLGALDVSSLLGALQAIAILAAGGVPLGAILGMGHWQGRKRIERTGLSPHRIHVAVESNELASLARGILEQSGAERVEASPGRSL